jgi:hypothetical protein
MMTASPLLITSLVTSPAKAYAESLLAKEYFLKAAFIYNFARLVEWPANTFGTDLESDSFRLCFIGKDPFENALRSIRNKKVAGRPLIIQRFIQLNEVQTCHILFISSTEEKQLQKILNAVKQSPVLTVSEIPEFAEKSGHIRFFLNKNEKLNLEVNLDSIKQAGLSISSRILTLAKIVSTKEIIEP